MASLGSKGGVFLVRFWYAGRQYKKSLKTRSQSDAQAAMKIVEVTLHRLLTGQIVVPEETDPGDFIVSGGTLTAPKPKKKSVELAAPLPTYSQLVEAYLEYQKVHLAATYHYSQAIHLRHLKKHLGARADHPCECITQNHLDCFLQMRMKVRDAQTVCRERNTIRQFFKWTVAKKHLRVSPADGLERIKAGADLPPFRTIAEIERILERGGLAETEQANLWNCIYLSPAEIGEVLATVRANATDEASYMLHALPAYTGMRRGEALRLRWIDVDFENGRITARSRKQSRARKETARQIDIHPDLRRELLAWRTKRPKGQFVLCDGCSLEPFHADKANRLFWQPMRGTKWCLDSKKNWFKVSFHVYRHSFVSNLAAIGVDQRVIDEWTGHTTEAMRRRYRHLFPMNRKSAIERLCFAASGGDDGHARPVVTTSSSNARSAIRSPENEVQP